MGLLENYKLTVDTSRPGAGPVGPVVQHNNPTRYDTYLSIDNNIHSKLDNNTIPPIMLIHHMLIILTVVKLEQQLKNKLL